MYLLQPFCFFTLYLTYTWIYRRLRGDALFLEQLSNPTLTRKQQISFHADQLTDFDKMVYWP